MQTLFSTVPEHDYVGLDKPKRIAKFLDFEKKDMAQAIEQPKNSIRYDDRIPKEVATRVEEIGVIINLVADFFEGDLTKTQLWFNTTNPLLGDQSPKDMIRLGRYKKLHTFVTNAILGINP